MLLFCILILTLALLVIFTVVAVATAGAVSIVVFGDVIVCIVLIVWLLRFILKKWRGY